MMKIMKDSDDKLMDNLENDILQMICDTKRLIADHNAEQLAIIAVAAHESNDLSNNIEFWKWMDRNYGRSGIFNSNESMRQYIAQGVGKEEWVIKQLQGKGYEWDWMSTKRSNINNIFNTYDAGDVANRVASDVTEKNILTGKSREYQMKAYTGKSNPHLKNTPKDMAVVTNAEKVNVVKANGYKDVEGYQNKQIIKKATDKRWKQIKNGRACTSYDFSSVATTMARAGLIGCIIGVGTETITTYKAWKVGRLTDEEYLKSILKSGGNSSMTTGITAGIMTPVSISITAIGASTVLTIPIAFAVGGIVNSIVAPCFGRGKYRELLSEAKYYQDLEDVYNDLIMSMQNASIEYYDFMGHMNEQQSIHKDMQSISMEINKELKNLYDSI